jgi:hypothetical protein
VNQKLEIAKRRDHLQSRIDVWNKKANEYLTSAELDDGLDLHDLVCQDGEGYEILQDDTVLTDTDADADADTDNKSGSLPTSHRRSAEDLTLYFPSSFASEMFPKQALGELSLRQGQANDSLHCLRIALGKKSFLFRTNVRSAKSQQRKTRAWAEVSNVDTEVRQHARIYNNCRRRMVRLEAEAEVLERYRVLTHGDLKISTAIATPNARGQRSTHLAWFWNMDVQADTDTDGWMEECRSIFIFR